MERLAAQERTGLEQAMRARAGVRVVAAQLRSGRAADGLVAAMRDVGEALRRWFPRAPSDRNELQDDVTAGESG